MTIVRFVQLPLNFPALCHRTSFFMPNTVSPGCQYIHKSLSGYLFLFFDLALPRLGDVENHYQYSESYLDKSKKSHFCRRCGHLTELINPIKMLHTLDCVEQLWYAREVEYHTYLTHFVSIRKLFFTKSICSAQKHRSRHSKSFLKVCIIVYRFVARLLPPEASVYSMKIPVFIICIGCDFVRLGCLANDKAGEYFIGYHDWYYVCMIPSLSEEDPDSVAHMMLREIGQVVPASQERTLQPDHQHNRWVSVG